MDVNIVTVTPELAAEWLTRNVSYNRKRHEAYVDDLAAEILAGRWRTNGASVQFNEKGELFDGQHRLSAVVKAGLPVEMVVATGVSDLAFYVTDIGRKRSMADVLNLNSDQSAILGQIGTVYAGKRLAPERLHTEIGPTFLPLIDRLIAKCGSKRIKSFTGSSTRTAIVCRMALGNTEWVENTHLSVINLETETLDPNPKSYYRQIIGSPGIARDANALMARAWSAYSYDNRLNGRVQVNSTARARAEIREVIASVLQRGAVADT